MLIQQTISHLHELRLNGMVNALEIQLNQTAAQALPFEDRLGILVDAEKSLRETKRLMALLKSAKLHHSEACIDNINFDPNRKLDRAFIMTLATCNWVDAGQHIILTGATGTGKSWLACALGNQICRQGKSVRYFRLSRLVEQLAIAKGDGSLARLRSQLAKTTVIIIDDWLMAPLNTATAYEILELFDDRANKSSLILASQHPVENWYDRIGDATFADAILDRVVHSAHRIEIKGQSMRKSQGLKKADPG